MAVSCLPVCFAHGDSPHGLLAQGSYAHIGFACAFLAEFDGAVYKGEERVVFTDTHVFTGVVNRAALTNDDVARLSELATE